MKALRITLALLITVSLNAEAQAPAAAIECLDYDDNNARLRCFDLAIGYKPKEPPKAEERAPVRWKVRDSNTISPVGDADWGAKPGLFQLGRSDGKDFSAVKASLVGVQRAIDAPGRVYNTWEPFFGVSWDKDTTTSKPKDMRQAFVGITGQLNESGPEGTSLNPTFRIGFRDDARADTHGLFATAHVDVIRMSWVNDPELPDRNATVFVPFFGLHTTRTRTSPSAVGDGTYTGTYIGAKAEIKLWAFVPRLSVVGQAQYYRDLDTSGDAAKRNKRFATVGLKYDLVDASAKKGWVPSLSLTRQSGADPVTGDGPANKTVLGLGVKYD